jgi:hypothetical protein
MDKLLVPPCHKSINSGKSRTKSRLVNTSERSFGIQNTSTASFDTPVQLSIYCSIAMQSELASCANILLLLLLLLFEAKFVDFSNSSKIPGPSLHWSLESCRQ